MHAVVLALTLAAPTEVFEEWNLSDTAPLVEVLTARAVYHRVEGDTALLPESVRHGPRPTVYAFGHTTSLRARYGARGWEVALPAGDRPTVRLLARVSRSPEAPRMFRLRWPRPVAGAVPTRRLAVVSRAWLDGRNDAWTCPEEPEDDVPCVSHEHLPGALVTRVPAATSPRGSLLAAWVLSAIALSLVGVSPRHRGERVFAALGGVAVALSLSLSLVGARACAWGAAGLWTVPAGALLGAVAPRTRWSRLAGTAALVLVPLLAIVGAPVDAVLAVALLFAAAVCCGAMGVATP